MQSSFSFRLIMVFVCFLLGLSIQAQNQPNIILIVADDLGYGDLSINGSKQICTPHIDELAKSGVSCSQGYVSAPVCAPSRAGLMTGRNQVSFGFDNNLAETQPGFDPAFLGLPLSETTIAKRLQKLGYVTGLVGKWHLGMLPEYHPGERGFDEYWTYRRGSHDYFEADPNGTGIKDGIDCNYKEVSSISYITDDKGGEAVDFIKRHQDQRFFLFVSFNAPHTPMQAKQEDLEKYQHIIDPKRRTYAAMVHSLDENVGRIMKQVKKSGLKKETLVVFLSDNGGPTTSNASINAPFNGQKGILLEGGIHVPFVLSWPGVFTKNSVYDQPVIATDLALTFFELAGGKAEEDDFESGCQNLITEIKSRPFEMEEREMKWRFTISSAIREGKWKLVNIPDRLPMLFDISLDLGEQSDVALQHLEVTKRLLKKLGDWDVKQPHPYFLEGFQWKQRQLKLYDRKYRLVQPE